MFNTASFSFPLSLLSPKKVSFVLWVAAVGVGEGVVVCVVGMM